MIEIIESNTTYPVPYFIGAPIRKELKKKSAKEVLSISYENPVGYSGTITIRTKEKGDIVHKVDLGNYDESITLDLLNYPISEDENVSVNSFLIEGFYISLNPVKGTTPTIHKSNLIFDIRFGI